MPDVMMDIERVSGTVVYCWHNRVEGGCALLGSPLYEVLRVANVTTSTTSDPSKTKAKGIISRPHS